MKLGSDKITPCFNNFSQDMVNYIIPHSLSVRTHREIHYDYELLGNGTYICILATMEILVHSVG